MTGYLSKEAIAKTIELLNAKKTIRDIYKNNYRIWHYMPSIVPGYTPPTSNISASSNNSNSIQTSLSNNDADPILEAKKAYIEKLSTEEDKLVPENNNVDQEQTSRSTQNTDENIKAILFKLNRLEHKITRMDKFINQIVEDRNKMHSLSKSIINSITEVSKEK